MHENQTPNSRRLAHPVHKSRCAGILFRWLLPYLFRHRASNVENTPIFNIERIQRSSYLSSKIQTAWDNEMNDGTENASLLRAISVVFKKQLYFYGVYFMIIELIKIGQPLLIARLVLLFDHPETKLGKLETLVHALVIVLSSLVQILCNHNYQMGVMDLGMRIRTATCTLVYRKALKLNTTALVGTSVGQMVNLLSVDVGRLDYAIQSLHHIWMAPLETVLVAALLYGYVGWSGLVGLVVMLAVLPLQICLAKWASKYTAKIASRTDERARLMNEVISGIQVIKMYTWEKPFANIVEMARKEEISKIRGSLIIKAILTGINIIMSRTAIFACILTYVVTGNTLTATYAYTITSFYQHLRITVTIFFPQAILQLFDTRISIRRIREFLLKEEVVANVITTNGDTDTNKVPTYPFISIRKASFKWLKSSSNNTLDNISFESRTGQLVAVVGPVGSGKTTLLHAILSEIEKVSGEITVKGTISYASQEPWLFGATIRQNILFGQPYDEAKYNEVVRICCLEEDLNRLPNRDGTLVGEKGVTLSGGQKARVNLARAVYKDADIYLLDDPLSAVDTHVGERLFSECITGYLGDKCVVLVTHQLQYLRDFPEIYLLEGGRVRASGSYQEMQSSDSQFATLMEESMDQERRSEENRLSRVEENMGGNHEYVADESDNEEMATGKVTWNVYKSYLKPGPTWFKAMAILLGFVLNELFGSSADCVVSVWVNLKQDSQITNSTSTSVRTLWDIQLTDEISLYIYSSLIVLFITISFVRTISFAEYCIDASTRLHNSMFSRIVIAPMKLFNANPSGRIINRFSKDIHAIDDMVPFSLQDTLTLGMSVLAISIIIGVMHPWVFMFTSLMLVAFYLMRQAFLGVSRNIKRVEAVNHSPIYSHLSQSLSGLSTIRANGAQERLIREFHDLQDDLSCANFMFITINKGFAVWLDFACILYILFVALSMLFIERDTLGGSVGLSLTQAIALSGMFQWGIRQWTDLENQMTSVERIQEYTEITPELDQNPREPPRLWPEHGELRFENISLRYPPSESYVLKELSFEIRPKEKVGIVGRTGAGKSSLIQALFRLADIEGHIWIDGVDTKTVSLNILRSKISIIPQEPVLFSGTMRRNLDPFEEYDNEDLWRALEEVELKNTVKELEGGLDSKMTEGGSNFSVGQRQLVCLARAIVRNNKILVLDEATANVDPVTDGLIQRTIRRRFADCTILTIAHRLNTIMDSDKVLVMDAGKAVEFDHPFLLLQNPEGFFHGLVKRTGPFMARNLYDVAEQNFRTRDQR